MAEKIYCKICENNEEYNVEKTKIIEVFFDTPIEFIGFKTTCKKCNNEIYTKKFSELNNKISGDKYREIIGLIKVVDIFDILYKTNINPEDLSIKLGWHKNTIEKYLNGYLPSKENSDILLNLLNNSNLLEEILKN